MADGYVLSESDLKKLRALLEQAERRTISTTGRPRTEPLQHQAPETYVARSPAAGIPALAEVTGTGSFDVPGYADCDIYRVVLDGATPTLRPISGLSKRVYNTSATEILGAEWLLVTRDKAGSWFPSGGGALAGNMSFVRATSYTKNGDGYYPGQQCIFHDPDDVPDVTACLIADVNNAFLNLADWFLARVVAVVGGVPVYASETDRGLWAKITGGTDGSYSWEEQIPQPGGTFTRHPSYRSGTLNAKELGGNEDVTTNSIVRLWPTYGEIASGKATHSAYAFSWPNPSANADQLTVGELSGGVTVNNVDTELFDDTVGFRVVDLGGGTALVTLDLQLLADVLIEYGDLIDLLFIVYGDEFWNLFYQHIDLNEFLLIFFPNLFEIIIVGGSPRLSLRIGCGLYRDQTGSIAVYNTDLVGPGIGTSGNCGLQVRIGCGLEIDLLTNRVRVDPNDLAGVALKRSTPGLCKIDVNYGCGLTIDSATNKLKLDMDTLAGSSFTGLYVFNSSSCTLGVLTGCNTTISDSNEVVVDTYGLAGTGLFAQDDCRVGIDFSLCQRIVERVECVNGVLIETVKWLYLPAGTPVFSTLPKGCTA